MKLGFIWDDWNREHIAKHNVSPQEATSVVLHAAGGYPQTRADGKSLVRGCTQDGRYLQVIFVLRSVSEIDYKAMRMQDIIELPDDCGLLVYIIHARDLSRSEKSKLARKL